ncbi:transcription elongation factor GreA [Candidatus Persebacteraceae bacterium Df01]|uniref:Transcription elongation factor GreA n=1 Tax=Candidatus Doriopsillibacter californiensis TaxID=2970740 RepID=A0ABT7QMC8_9GAMM|nr:transcription elongation factor GreA [Candidatus Persebacteraceae bacterium Df01]
MMSVPITKEGKIKLQGELDKLKNTERPAIIKAIAEARAHGDLSENAEYHSAKEKQGLIEARIKELDSVLSGAQVIDPMAVGADGRCIFGSYVTLQDGEGKTIKYRLVSEYEADLEQGLLSAPSPIGRALLGKYAGDSVVAQTPGGVQEYAIVAIAYE